MPPKTMEASAGAAATMTFTQNVGQGGVGWTQSSLTAIEGATATAKFGGGGMSDVPTVLGGLVVADGGTVRWHIKVDRKKAAGAPMRMGVQRTGVRIGSNWNDKTVRGQAWYLDSSGDLLDGCDTVAETGMQWGDGDVVGLTLDYRTLTFTINGKDTGGKITGVQGEVHCAVQLFSKGDKVTLVDQYMPDPDEIDDTQGSSVDPFANHNPSLPLPVRAPERKTPAGTPEDPYRFGGVLPDKQFHPSSSPAPGQPKFHHSLTASPATPAGAPPALEFSPADRAGAGAVNLTPGGKDLEQIGGLQELDSIEVEIPPEAPKEGTQTLQTDNTPATGPNYKLQESPSPAAAAAAAAPPADGATNQPPAVVSSMGDSNTPAPAPAPAAAAVPSAAPSPPAEEGKLCGCC